MTRDYTRIQENYKKNSIEDKDKKIFNFILFLFFLLFVTIFFAFYFEKSKIHSFFNDKYSNKINYNGIIQNIDITCGKKNIVTLSDGTYNCNIFPIKILIGNIEIGKINNTFVPYISIAGKKIKNYEKNKNLITKNKNILKFIYAMDNDTNKTNGIYISKKYKNIINRYIKKETKFEDIDKTILNKIILKTSNI